MHFFVLQEFLEVSCDWNQRAETLQTIRENFQDFQAVLQRYLGIISSRTSIEIGSTLLLHLGTFVFPMEIHPPESAGGAIPTYSLPGPGTCRLGAVSHCF